MPLCLVSLGSNLRDRSAMVHSAMELISKMPGVEGFISSSLHETSPVGGPEGQGAFLNSAVAFESAVGPEAVFEGLLEIEQGLDRTRRIRWEARTIDLDLLAYGDRVLKTPRLRLPHPRMSFRPFVLDPLCEVTPHWKHPEINIELRTLQQVLIGGDNSIRVVGGEGSTLANLVSTQLSSLPQSHRKTLKVIGRQQLEQRVPASKLSIGFGPESYALSVGPTLCLEDCPLEDWGTEVSAAIECVWPEAGRDL